MNVTVPTGNNNKMHYRVKVDTVRLIMVHVHDFAQGIRNPASVAGTAESGNHGDPSTPNRQR